MIASSQIFKTIQDNDLYVLPLFSIQKNSICGCGDAECSSPGKHPFFKYNWKIIATNRKEKILKWSQTHKDLNWGILTGRKSSVVGKYLIVVDVDTTQHEILKTLPKTFGYSTGNGHHFWFWSDVPVKSSVSLIANKVDIRGTNGYVVIPPSKHVSGRKYKFINGETCEILDLPDEYKKQVDNPPSIKIKKKKLSDQTPTNDLVEEKTMGFYVLDNLPVAAVRKIINTEYKIPEGTRNKTLFRLLCSDRARGHDSEQLTQKAEEYKEKCENSETISNKELSILVTSVSKYPAYRNLSSIEAKNVKTEFFNNFIKSKTSWVSLKVLAEDYQKTYNESLDLYAAANYLKNNGFSKRRVSKGNVWGLLKNFSLEKLSQEVV